MPHPVERDPALEMEDDSDGLDLDDADVEPITITGHNIRAQGSDEAEWRKLELERQLKDVMGQLRDGHRRWGDDGPADIPLLELYKKATLATKRDAEATRATALHILARQYKTDYADIPGEIIRPVIRDLLIQNNKPSVETEIGEKRKEEPILKVAITFSNDEFIHQVKEAWPEGFPDLLDAKDSDGKNALHHTFVWPDEKMTVRPEADAKMVLERALKFVPVAKEQTIAAQDADGNTPIHYASDYRQCYQRPDEYVAIYKEMVRMGDDLMMGESAFNNRDESPILYGQRTLAHCEKIMEEKKTQRQRAAAMSKLTQISTSSPETKTPPPRKEAASPIGNLAAWKDSQSKVGSTSLRKELGAVETNGQWADKSKMKGSADGRSSRRMSIADEQPKKESYSEDTKKMPPPSAWSKQPPAAKPAKDKTSKTTQGRTAAPSAVATSKRAKAKAYTDILQFLRLHYIRSRPDMDARDLIHGKDVSDKNLYFDASGHSQADTIITLIERMSVGGFLDTLAYVYIPSLDQTTAPVKHEKTARKVYGRGRAGQMQENPKMGRNDLVSVFDKLSSCGVTRILRLQVDDLEDPAHTDSAIEMALQGAESLASQDQEQPPAQARNLAHPSILVETWDWRKADISPDVIAAAAPGVEHVNLYWSGNQAVLRGWGSSAGIPRLVKLKTLRVYASPGLESVAKMNKMLEIFKNDIFSNTSGRVKDVKIIPRINGLIASQNANEEQGDPTGSPTGGQVTVAQRQHVWVSTMDEFRKSMVSVHKTLKGLQMNMEPYRIKVALIDDGLELSQLLTYNGIVEAMGRSYYPPSGRTENPWHRSTEGHGTIMANMIARVNPWVSLHVMRVHNKRLANGERTVLADSAAKAIWGAIRRRVNIISISWTVKGRKPSGVRSNLYDGTNGVDGAGISAAAAAAAAAALDPDAEAIGKLEAAIDEAVRQNILIFCSASDQIEEDAKDSLPYRQAPGHVFRIGAALPHGQSAPETEDKGKIDYFFPGSQVAEDFNPRGSKLPRFHDGSSVATALAAGLASLVMHCAVVMREYNKKKPDTKDPAVQDYYTKAAAALQSRDNMKQAFDNIGIGKPEDKYLEVWKEFGAASEKIAALGTRESDTAEKNRKKMELLDELARTLCHKTKLDDVAHGQFGA